MSCPDIFRDEYSADLKTTMHVQRSRVMPHEFKFSVCILAPTSKEWIQLQTYSQDCVCHHFLFEFKVLVFYITSWKTDAIIHH